MSAIGMVISNAELVRKALERPAGIELRRAAEPHLVQISAALPTFFRGEFRAAGFFQCRQVGLHELPQDGCSDALVVVAQYVADPRNFLPRDFRIARFQIIRKMTTGLGNYLNTALDEPLPLSIVFECFERHIRQYAIDAFDRLDDVRQARDERTYDH
jgi:hypothetical protein